MKCLLIDKKNKPVAMVRVDQYEFGDKPDTHPDVIIYGGHHFYRYIHDVHPRTYRLAIVADLTNDLNDPNWQETDNRAYDFPDANDQ